VTYLPYCVVREKERKKKRKMGEVTAGARCKRLRRTFLSTEEEGERGEGNWDKSESMARMNLSSYALEKRKKGRKKGGGDNRTNDSTMLNSSSSFYSFFQREKGRKRGKKKYEVPCWTRIPRSV